MLRNKTKSPEDNGWKLIDYGMVTFVADSKDMFRKFWVGTWQWMPPEILPDFGDHSDEKGNYISYGVDVWSLGAIIHYMMMGHHLYELTEKEIADLDRWWGAVTTPSYYWYDDKLMQRERYDMDSGKNKGEIHLRKHLMKLMEDDKISSALCSLLHEVFQFDPRKRPKCAEILSVAGCKIKSIVIFSIFFLSISSCFSSDAFKAVHCCHNGSLSFGQNALV